MVGNQYESLQGSAFTSSGKHHTTGTDWKDSAERATNPCLYLLTVSLIYPQKSPVTRLFSTDATLYCIVLVLMQTLKDAASAFEELILWGQG